MIIKKEANSSTISWIQRHASLLLKKHIALFCMEGYIPELTGDAREANMIGGLAIDFGDMLEGLYAIDANACGYMPLYSKRYVQTILNGRQHVTFKDVSYDGQPLEVVLGIDGKPVEFNVWGWDKVNTNENMAYHIKVYKIMRGGAPLYLFWCPEIFDILYIDHRNNRYLQEVIFAKCVYELFQRIGFRPDILHFNEGHVADVMPTLSDIEGFEKIARVYTNHSVVKVALEVFDVTTLDGGDAGRVRYIGFPNREWNEYWRRFTIIRDGKTYLDFSNGVLKCSDVVNGVSSEHARVTKNEVFPDYEGDMIGILNGSGDTWVMPEILTMTKEIEYDNGVALDELSDKEFDALFTPDEVKTIKEIISKAWQRGRLEAKDEVKKRTAGTMTNASGNIISETGIELDLNKPTVWLDRRIVKYKSQYPVLRLLVHLTCADRREAFTEMELRQLLYRDCPDLMLDINKKIVDITLAKIFKNATFEPMKSVKVVYGLGMQIVVAGMEMSDERWIEKFVNWTGIPGLKGKFVFVPGSDSLLLKMQAIGADVCLNCPLPKKEACGTSDQRHARKGGINIATRSGGPPDYLEDGKSGFLVGPYKDDIDFYENAPSDIWEKLLIASDMYYNRDTDNRWDDMMYEAWKASRKVTAAAMGKRYAKQAYQPAIIKRTGTNYNISEVEVSAPKPLRQQNLISIVIDSAA